MADAAKIQRTTAKTKFTRAEKSLSNALDSDGTPLNTMTRRFDDFKTAFRNTEDTHDTYVALLAGEADEEFEEAWMNAIAERFETLEIKYDTKVKAKSETIAPVVATTPNVINVQQTKERDAFKHDTMKFPPFDGNIRKYAKWKEEFDIHVKPHCKVEQLAFILKSHLCEELRDEMDILGGSADEIWERLDQRYGNKGRLVDTILAEVKGIEQCNNDETTLKMIKMIERCYNELKATGKECEMNNTTIISMIEEKMPLEMSTEWIKLITKRDANHDDKFSTLKTLLDDWRGRIEYKVANVRATIVTPQESSVLLGTSNTRPNNNTNSRSYSCWIHTTNDSHPIWRCKKFQGMPVDERIELVRQNRACFKCLEKGHATAACPKTFKCTFPNCNQYHNKLLHKDNNQEQNANNGNNMQLNQVNNPEQQQQLIQQQIQQLQQQQLQLQQQQINMDSMNGNNNANQMRSTTAAGQTFQTSGVGGGGTLLASQ